MSRRLIASGAFASRHPAFAPRRELINPAFPIWDMSRRMTTGFVLTLPAICSEVVSSAPPRSLSAIHASACVAMVSLLFAPMQLL
jgi:hypothetical protein